MNVNANDNANYIASVYANRQTTRASLSVKGSYLDITGGVNGSYLAQSGDKADVSNAAREMLSTIKELDAFSFIFPNNDPRQRTKSLAEVEGDFMSGFTDFADSFSSLSSMMGLTGSFTMGIDGVGGMTVAGEDAGAAAKLQSGFNQNSTTVARFALMAAQGALADAGYTLDGFKDAYAEDPIAAIKDNIDSLKERLLGFRAVAGNGSMQYGFVRDASLEIDYSETSVAYGAATTATIAATAEA